MGPETESKVTKLLIKKCHNCGNVMELKREVDKCTQCSKAFLPMNYFAKVHDKTAKFKDLFANSSEMHEEELVKGLHALW